MQRGEMLVTGDRDLGADAVEIRREVVEQRDWVRRELPPSGSDEEQTVPADVGELIDDPFEWRSEEGAERRRQARMSEFMYSVPVLREPPRASGHQPEDVAVSLAWFPSGEYEEAINRWPSLAEDWADVPHGDYCARLDGNIKWIRGQGVPIRAIAPIVVAEYAAWCAEHDENPEEARAAYAVHRMQGGDAISWPPGRNEPCWCGSGRKYKRCCGPAPARPMHDPRP